MTRSRTNATGTTTLGSTALALGSTTTSVSGLTLSSPTIGTITNTGTLTLPTTTGTVALTSQLYTAPTIGSTSITSGGTFTTLPGVTSVNGSTVPSSDTLVGRATTDTLTNKTLTTPALNGAVFNWPVESWYINATAFAGYTAYLQTNGAVHYLTTTSTANGTLNMTATSGTTLNSIMTTGQAITFSLLITNTTAYYANAYQVDGTTSGVTVKWSGGTAPSAGNASAIDIYQFTVLKTGSAAWTVFAAGPVKYA
jgi:hypothetical protein